MLTQSAPRLDLLRTLALTMRITQTNRVQGLQCQMKANTTESAL